MTAKKSVQQSNYVPIMELQKIEIEKTKLDIEKYVMDLEIHGTQIVKPQIEKAKLEIATLINEIELFPFYHETDLGILAFKMDNLEDEDSDPVALRIGQSKKTVSTISMIDITRVETACQCGEELTDSASQHSTEYQNVGCQKTTDCKVTSMKNKKTQS